MNRNILSLIYLVITIYCKEEKKIDISVYDNIVNAEKITNYEYIEKLLYTTDMTYLVYYHNVTSRNSVMGAYYLQRLDRKLDYITKIFLIDCNNIIPKNIKKCQLPKNETLDPYPQFDLLIPPLFRFDPRTKKMNYHTSINWNKNTISEELIYEFITSNINSYSTQIQNEEILEKFINTPIYNKVILFTAKNDTPIMYKGISNYFYDRILFGEIKANQTNLVDKYNITKFPSIICLENNFFLDEGPLIHYYTGISKPSDIVEFIENYARREKYYVQLNRDKSLLQIGIKKIDIMNYETYFENEKKFNKIVLYTNQTTNYETLSPEIKSFINTTNGYFSFATFDCSKTMKICSHELFPSIENFPSLVYYEKSDNFYEMINKARLLPLNNSLFDYFYNEVKEITNDELEDVIEKSRLNKKFPLIYLSERKDKISILPLYLLSSFKEYEKKIEFYRVVPNEESMKLLNVNTLPSISIVLHNNKRKRYKTNNLDIINYFNLKTFIENEISDFVFEKNIDNYYKDKLNPKNEFKFLNYSAHLYKECVYKGLHCAFVMLDGEYDTDIDNINLSYKKYSTIIKDLENLKYLTQYSNFFIVNATCHTELMSSFKIDLKKLPSLIIYDSKFQMFTKMKGDFYLDKVNEFLVDAIDNRALYRKLNREHVIFKDIDCTTIKKKAKRLDYDKEDRIRQGYDKDEDDEYEELNIIDRDL